MTAEDRLRRALHGADEFHPSPDLWMRVHESIEADRAHRRRIRRLGLVVVASMLVLVLVGALFTDRDRLGRLIVDWRAMEGLEVAAMAALIVALGPAIRRFGRGYANVVFRANPPTGSHLLRLLDVAYYLVFSGYVLVTRELAIPSAMRLSALAGQLQESGYRIGGLLLLMGLLHALTFVVLPMAGLMFTLVWRNAEARKGRWLLISMVAGFVVVGGLILANFVAIGLSQPGGP